MAKEKKEINLSEQKPKKGIFKAMFSGKSEQKKILSHAKVSGIKNFLFYTNVENLLFILENGIQLLKDKNLKPGEHYVVWTHSEHNNSIGLEYENSTRAHFWKWASEADIDIEDIATIGIDIQRLGKSSKQDWALDKHTNIVYAYEAIPVSAINWIMIKNKRILKQIETFVMANDIDIDVFYGENGNIKKQGE